ncbi:unnamed protein product [Chondrus crispus]|uniref:Uncharacterized protein n=1 Tax=Chondrus crispus TaxID=2769 RepID=R7Q0M0_CHOCR|nr:unnamed protein product [Chondrus crispus]CDF32197.1 unnamed protein product [Chondrus crispus]|eukprot:XP_005711862.1 unnamed protein product [Chondrus crispus]
MLSFISALPPSLHLPPHHSPARCTLSTSLPLTATPRGPSVSYAQILSHSVSAVESLVTANPPTLHLTLDFPPDRSETDTGTLVSRYENNLNFAEKLLLELGASSPTPVGPNIQICDNINPQGGGEYLTDDEVMVGLKAPVDKLGGRVVTVLLNAGVDVDSLTLRQSTSGARSECSGSTAPWKEWGGLRGLAGLGSLSTASKPPTT